MKYKYYLKRIKKAINHINKSYLQLEKFYEDNDLESLLDKDSVKFYKLGIYHLIETDEILSNTEIELDMDNKKKGGSNE